MSIFWDAGDSTDAIDEVIARVINDNCIAASIDAFDSASQFLEVDEQGKLSARVYGPSFINGDGIEGVMGKREDLEEMLLSLADDLSEGDALKISNELIRLAELIRNK